jgi:fructose-bisphosphate aldolase, class II
MLVTTKLMLKKAMAGKYAIGAFNVYNMETVKAVAEAAEEMKSPAIIAVTEGSARYAGIDTMVAMVRSIASGTKAPLALHLDHGRDLKVIEKCIKAGFTSLMIDASHLPFDENVDMTRNVVKIAHRKGITIESELGKITGVEDNVSSLKEMFTDPHEAKEFVRKTKVDSLAVAIGTSHGAYKFKTKSKLDFDRLESIREAIKVPLVLHGASQVTPEIIKKARIYGLKLEGAKGVDWQSLKKACSLGISKINTDTDLRIAHAIGLREYFRGNPSEIDPRKIEGFAMNAVTKMIIRKMSLFGSVAKC